MNNFQTFNNDTSLLVIAAITVAFTHTLLGPDHYLPFIAISKAGKWSNAKTIIIVSLCGVAHVMSSVLLALGGIGLGMAASELINLNSVRGELAAWILISFGLVYCLWGIKKAIAQKSHSHTHNHTDGMSHFHEHSHNKPHVHIHDSNDRKATPWILFIIFIFGPCEPLIPLIMYPAAKENVLSIILVTTVFGITTIATMLAVTLLGITGIKLINTRTLETYIHVIAGATILVCGLSIKFLGL